MDSKILTMMKFDSIFSTYLFESLLNCKTRNGFSFYGILVCCRSSQTSYQTDEISIKDLAEYMRLTPRTVHKMINELVNLEIIESIPGSKRGSYMFKFIKEESHSKEFKSKYGIDPFENVDAANEIAIPDKEE